MYEKKIAQLIKQLEDESSRCADLEEQLSGMRDYLSGNKKSVQVVFYFFMLWINLDLSYESSHDCNICNCCPLLVLQFYCDVKAPFGKMLGKSSILLIMFYWTWLYVFFLTVWTKRTMGEEHWILWWKVWKQ